MMKWTELISLLVAAVALTLSIIVLTEEEPPRLVTVNATALVSEKIIELAEGDLTDEEAEERALEWADELNRQVGALSEARNLVIVPASFGVHGAPDLTSLVRAIMKQVSKEAPSDS